MPRYPKNLTPMRSVGARVKKIKKVFDPSEHNVPRKRSLRSTSASGGNNNNVGDSVQKNAHSKAKRSRPTSRNQNHHQQQSQSILLQQQHNSQMRQQQQLQLQQIDNNHHKKNSPVLELQSNNNDTCIVCEKSETKRNKNLIPCKDCNYKIHPECLKINFQNPNLAEERWRCNNCKTCVVCDETREAGYLLTCCVCIDAYHYNCHTPKLQRNEVNKIKWECYKCLNMMKQTLSNNMSLIDEKFENNDKDDKSKSSIIINNVTESLSLNLNEKNSRTLSTNKRNKTIKIKSDNDDDDDDDGDKIDDNNDNNGNNDYNRNVHSKKYIPKIDNVKNDYDDALSLSSSSSNQSNEIKYNIKDFLKFFTSKDDVPDIKNWSCKMMANYIEQYLPDEASTFIEQHIDGASCLLLKRSDIIKRFDLKLGPAIRLYSLVVGLQTRKRDMTLTWM